MKEPKTTETDDTKKKFDTCIIFRNNQMELMDDNITDNWKPMNKNFSNITSDGKLLEGSS